jgi:hypothetical protein
MEESELFWNHCVPVVQVDNDLVEFTGTKNERELCRLCIGMTLQQRRGKMTMNFADIQKRPDCTTVDVSFCSFVISASDDDDFYYDCVDYVCIYLYVYVPFVSLFYFVNLLNMIYTSIYLFISTHNDTPSFSIRYFVFFQGAFGVCGFRVGQQGQHIAPI